jgi:hypothetical protein
MSLFNVFSTYTPIYNYFIDAKVRVIRKKANN